MPNNVDNVVALAPEPAPIPTLRITRDQIVEALAKARLTYRTGPNARHWIERDPKEKSPPRITNRRVCAVSAILRHCLFLTDQQISKDAGRYANHLGTLPTGSWENRTARHLARQEWLAALDCYFEQTKMKMGFWRQAAHKLKVIAFVEDQFPPVIELPAVVR